jgi:hypothetical protein
MAYTAQIATERQPLRASGEMAAPASPDGREQPSVLLLAAWHAVAWLTISNFIGVGLAVLLIWPRSGAWLGAWTYGRWMPVHLNSQLYGWCSLPLVAWLLRIYQADRGWLARWSSIALLLWSLALAIGSVSWLNGHSSGKLFLDWTGYTRVFFPLAILFLWCWRPHSHEAGIGGKINRSRPEPPNSLASFCSCSSHSRFMRLRIPTSTRPSIRTAAVPPAQANSNPY